MSFIALFNIVGAIALIITLPLLLLGKKRLPCQKCRYILGIVLILMLFVEISNALEHLHITDSLDQFGDYVEIIIPLLLGFFVYSMHADALSTELFQSKELQDLALAGAHLGTWSWNIQTNEASFDNRWAEMLGYDLDEIEPHVNSWNSFMHPEDKPRVDEVMENHLRGGSAVFEVEQRLRCKSGEWKWVLDRGRIIERDQNGKPLLMAGTLLDINDSKLMRERLDITENIYRTVFENTGTAVMIIEADMTISLANKRFAELVGKPKDQIEGMASFTSFVAEEDLERMKEYHVKRREDPNSAPHEYEFNLKDAQGDIKNILVTIAMIPDTEKSVASLHDVSKLKEAEQQRMQMEREVQYAQKLESLGVMAAGVAHDFNNILMAILGNADMLQSDMPESSPLQENVSEILNASQRATEICRQMLAYSGDQHFTVDNIDLNMEIKKISKMLETSIAKNAVLQYDFDQDMPRVSVDLMQLRQIILNLVMNGSEAVEESSGYITIATGSRDCTEEDLHSVYTNDNLRPGHYAYIQVKDNGVGMDSETLDKVFDPFFTSKFPGRGLGLPTVLGLVRGHEGMVDIDSEPGKGTTVTVFLPTDKQKAEEEAEDSETLSEIQPFMESKTVLLVDDESGVLTIAGKMLNNLGFEVLTACNGKKAIAVFEKNENIDCVILDLSMPHLGGKETFERLHSIRPDIPVMIASGYNMEHLEKTFAGKDIAGFITKPFRKAKLAKELHNLFAAGKGNNSPTG